jgi:tight adherence protein B
MQNMPMFFLVAVAIGGVAWVFLYPVLSGEKKAEKRQQSVVRADPAAPAARTARNQQKPRREQIEATLKQVEDRRAKSASLNVRIAQAGLAWSKQRFFITCAALAVIGLLIGFLLDGGLLTALGLGFAAGCGLPVLDAEVPKETPGSKIFERISGRGRYRCARRQGRPASP